VARTYALRRRPSRRDALNAQVRLPQAAEEQERIERERFQRLNAIKENLTYSDKLAQTICERVSEGALLTVLLRENDMPTMRRCNQWLKEHAEFQALMDMSKNDRLNIFEEEVIEIADDMNDFKTVIKNGKEKRVADPDMVARAKLRIEVRFKHLKSGRPQRWGDVSTLITKSDDPNSAANLSQEELEKRIGSPRSVSQTEASGTLYEISPSTGCLIGMAISARRRALVVSSVLEIADFHSAGDLLSWLLARN
jgi:hypothetical protein